MAPPPPPEETPAPTEPAPPPPPPPPPSDAPQLSKAQAAKLLKADMGNLVKKIQSGRTLSTAERQMLLNIQRGEDDGSGPAAATDAGAPVVWAKNKVELSEALGVTRQALDDWITDGECPKARSNGLYNVPEWKVWCETHGKKTGSKLPSVNSLRAKQVLLQNESLEFKLAVMRRDFVPARDVEHWVSEMILQAKKVLLQMPSSLAPQVTGVSVVEAEQLIRDAVNDSLAQLNVKPMEDVFGGFEKEGRMDDGD